ARRLTAHGHEPARVPALVAPAVVAKAAALIDLELEVAAVVAIEIDQETHAVEIAEIGVALPHFDRRNVAVRRMLTAQGQIEELLVERQARLAGIFLGRVADDAAEFQGLDALPANVVEGAVQQRPLGRLSA